MGCLCYCSFAKLYSRPWPVHMETWYWSWVKGPTRTGRENVAMVPVAAHKSAVKIFPTLPQQENEKKCFFHTYRPYFKLLLRDKYFVVRADGNCVACTVCHWYAVTGWREWSSNSQWPSFTHLPVKACDWLSTGFIPTDTELRVALSCLFVACCYFKKESSLRSMLANESSPM